VTCSESAAASPFVFVDAAGGALAAIGAAVAHAMGCDAVAATMSTPGALPLEVSAILQEVGMRAPAVLRLDEVELAGASVVFLGAPSAPEGLAAAEAWDLALPAVPDGASDARELERLATARIVRDRIERRLEASRGRPDSTRSGA
jgi:hypothetical protein